MSRLFWMGFGVVLAAAPTGCGYPTFSFGSGGAGGGSSVTSSSHSSSSGKTTTTTATTTTATTTTGTGTPTLTCTVLHDEEDCGAGRRCTIVDTVHGKTGCVAIAQDPLKPYDACPNGDADCPAGTWCDGRTAACMPFCTVDTDCKTGGDCVIAHAGMASIPNGLDVCTAHCDPIAATPCGKGATCAYDMQELDFDCFESGESPDQGPCTTSPDCAPGLVCGIDQSGNGTCLLWCEPAGEYSDVCFDTCNSFSNPITYNGVAYGYCD